MARIAVIYYSSTGTVHALAEALGEGAAAAGAEMRLRRVRELAPGEAIDRNPAWRRHVDAVADAVPEAALDDLDWADGIAFGTPSRFGAPAAQLKQFIDQAGGLWQQGLLSDKPVTAFTAAYNAHGGTEATILSLANVFYHWGALIVPAGYTDASVYAAGGNPYGASAVGSGNPDGPSASVLTAARHQGDRLTRITDFLLAGRSVAGTGSATQSTSR